MRRFLFFLVPVCVLATNCKDDPLTTGPGTDPMSTASALPLVEVTTEMDIENEPKVPGRMRIYQEGEEMFNSQIGIEYRGSTSFRLSDKKSFGFETWDDDNNDVDKAILGFPQEEDWILQGHVFRASEGIIFDPTLLRHHVGYELYRMMGNYASRSQFVELTVNGDFLGTYLLMEKLKRDKNRIDIARLEPTENEGEDLTGGYILKIDKTSGGDVAPDQPLAYYENNWADDARYNADISFRSDYGVDGSTLNFEPFQEPYHPKQYLETYFLYTYPRADRITPQQRQYIQNYVHAFETALLTDELRGTERTYTDYVDLHSFADHFLLNELVGNVDAYRLSTYLVKDKGGKLQMGPVWDLNIGYNGQDRIPVDDWMVNYNDYVPNDPWLVPFWWDRLLNDPVFVDILRARWTELRATVWTTPKVEGLVRQRANYLLDNGAIKRNYERWSGIEVDYEGELEAMLAYLRDRLLWMDSAIERM